MQENSRHLRRLFRVWLPQPTYFITTCVAKRRSILASAAVQRVLYEEWKQMDRRHGWAVGRFVVMPDHVHFFVREIPDQKGHTLARAIGSWKEWTAKQILPLTGTSRPLWQAEFFDHVLRSTESMSQKWDYIRNNPVRSGLVSQPDEWPFQGSIHFE